jgi:hypothetical protein
MCPWVRYSGGARDLLVLPRDSPFRRLDQLRGEIFAGPDRLAPGSVAVVRWLLDYGLKEDRDYKIITSVSFNTAILTMLHREAAAAISAPVPMQQMPARLRYSVRSLGDTGDYANLVYLANPHLGTKKIAQIRKLILQFGAGIPAGRAFLAGTGFGSIVPATVADIRMLDVYVQESRRLVSVRPWATGFRSAISARREGDDVTCSNSKSGTVVVYD